MPDPVMRELGRALGVEGPAGDGDDVEMDTALEQDEKSANVGRGEFEIVQRAVEKIVREGYSATQVLIQVSPRRVGV